MEVEEIFDKAIKQLGLDKDYMFFISNDYTYEFTEYKNVPVVKIQLLPNNTILYGRKPTF